MELTRERFPHDRRPEQGAFQRNSGAAAASKSPTCFELVTRARSRNTSRYRIEPSHPVLLQLLPELLARNAQEPRRLGAISTRSLHRLSQRALFDLGHHVDQGSNA